MRRMHTDSMHWLLALAAIFVPLLLAWLLLNRDERSKPARKPERKPRCSGD